MVDQNKLQNLITPKANHMLPAPSNLSGFQTRRNYHPRENMSHRNMFSKAFSRSNITSATNSVVSNNSCLSSKSPIKEIISTLPSTKIEPLSGNKTMGIRSQVKKNNLYMNP